MSEPRRRDLLRTAAFATAGVGAIFALYPFVAAMSPTDDIVAKRKTFGLGELSDARASLIEVARIPVMIFRRTADELEMLKTWTGDPLRDPSSDQSDQPAWAKNWHRSLQPEIMVCIATCTHPSQPCIVKKLTQYNVLLICPCCGSQFDLAGRVIRGPAPINLRVPPYRFVDVATIEFVETEVRA